MYISLTQSSTATCYMTNQNLVMSPRGLNVNTKRLTDRQLQSISVTHHTHTHPHTHWNSHSFTPWCRILFEKLIVTQLVKNITLSYGTRKFITAFTKARHRTLSWTSWIQFAPSILISLRSILMLPSHLCLGLPSGLLPSGLPTKTL
jgi:hypothetical protein